jgi:hypothetical protein
MLRIRAYGGSLALLVLAAVSCGDDEDTNAAASTGQATSTSTTSGVGGAGSGGAGGGVGGSGGSGGGAGYPRVGEIIATSYNFGGNALSSAVASFGRSCTSNDLGRCTVRVCSLGNPAGASEPVDAGEIQLMGGNQPVTLSPPTGLGAPYTDNLDESTALHGDGATIMFNAAGDECPALMTTLSDPGEIGHNSPPAIAQGLTHDTATAFPLNLANTQPVVEIVWLTADEEGSILCDFQGITGDTEIPAAAFADIPATVTGTFSMFSVAAAVLEPGDGWTVNVQLRHIWHQSGASPAIGPIELTVN